MKKYHFILIGLILCTCLSAQPFGLAGRGYQIDKLKYKNASGEVATTIFFYDHNNTLYKAFWTLDNNERWSLNYYERDSRGNLCSAFREFSDGLFTYEDFQFDKKGNITTEQFNRSDGLSGMATYVYKNNKCVKADYEKHKGWLSGTVYYYYEKGRKTRAELILHDEIRCEISYDYDKADNLIEEYWDFQGRWNQTYTYEYRKVNMQSNHYTSPYFQDLGEYRISKEDYTFNNKIGGPSRYYYNDKGHLEKKIFERSDGIRTTTVFTYHKNGQLKSSARDYSDGNSGYFTYLYDEQDRLIKREFFKNDSSVALESHLYDSEGRLTLTHLKNFDGWLNGTIEYKHNKSGKVSKGVFHGQDGFDAVLNFTYNVEGLLTDLVWEMSTGDVQKYQFEYEYVKKNK